MDTPNLKTLLNQLFDELTKVSSPLVNLFNNGIDKTITIEETRDLPIRLPAEVYDLYTWKNGLQDEQTSLKKLGELEILPLGIFSSLENSIRSYKYYAIENRFWDNHMFPLFESGGGDYYLIDCNPDKESYKMMWLFSNSMVEFNGFTTKYDSIESMVYSVIKCFQHGAYTYQPARPEDFSQGPYLEIDWDLEAKICKAINPNSQYWKMFS